MASSKFKALLGPDIVEASKKNNCCSLFCILIPLKISTSVHHSNVYSKSVIEMMDIEANTAELLYSFAAFKSAAHTVEL